MTEPASAALLWSPRILGILVALFIGVFALDAVNEGAAAFLIHLIPAVFLLLTVALAWRWPWMGGVIFVALAVYYAMSVSGHLNWVLAISGPLLVVGILFLWSWLRLRVRHA